MRTSYYEQSASRVNPEFVGVAAKFYQQKKQRQSAQSRRKALDCDVQFASKLQYQLQQSLQNKLGQLSRLREARQRNLEHAQQKQRLKEMRQKELQQLRAKNWQNRQAGREGIELARLSILQKKRKERSNLEKNLSELQERKFQLQESWLQQNSMRNSRIKQDRRFSKNRVDEYYREKNSQSLNAYLAKIKRQKKMRRLNGKQAKQNQIVLKDLSATVEVKKNQLREIQEQIFKYKTDLKSVHVPSKQEKRYFLMNRSQPKFVPAQISQISLNRQFKQIDD